jgi:hypothetical protein
MDEDRPSCGGGGGGGGGISPFLNVGGGGTFEKSNELLGVTLLGLGNELRGTEGGGGGGGNGKEERRAGGNGGGGPGAGNEGRPPGP